jgi:hypothetical protein
MALLPLPDFMTNASRELMLSAVFFAFFVGAMAAWKKTSRDEQRGVS